MSSLGSPNPFFIAGKKAYEIERSLRVNDDDSAYLSRTPSSAGNRRTFTISLWTKRANLTGALFGSYISDADRATLRFSSDYLEFQSAGASVKTNAVFRDPSAWYHIVCAIDTTQGTQSNRGKLYVNGVQQELSSNNFSQDVETSVNNNSLHVLGTRWASGSANMLYDGYLAEVHLIDGSALTPSSFAETDAVTGEYKPKKYTGGYGTNGFYLNFSDNSGTTATTLGKDSSGNGNNFTPNNFATTDAVKDTPTNNFCTLNPLDKGSITLSEGNLRATYAAQHETVLGTFGMTSGKWYWEVYMGDTSGSGSIAGLGSNSGGVLNSHVGSTATSWGYENSGSIWNNSSSTSGNAALANGDILGIAYDADVGSIKFYKNNTLQSNSFSSVTANNYMPQVSLYNSGSFWAINFGQDSSFQGNKTAQGNADGSGQGDFYYSPPSGYKALCSANLPNPTIKLPDKHFDTLLWTGNSTDNRAITGLNFQPDLTWIKRRSGGAQSHFWVDALRSNTDGSGGNGNVGPLATNDNYAETNTLTDGGFESFNSDGFTLGKGSSTANADAPYQRNNASGETYVGWNWKAGGSASSNSDGTITSSVSVNASAGFSIVTWTGTGSAGTIGHGLGVAPKWLVVKLRSGSQDWFVNNGMILNDYGKYFKWNSTNTAASDTNVFPNTAPTSTVFSVGTDNAVNGSTDNYIAYCFSEVKGYSKFGSYTGNQNADGTFVFTGFRPALVITKGDWGGNWNMYDNSRNSFNVANKTLYPNLGNAESTESSSGNQMDLLSNGFKLRGSDNDTNHAADFIYLAFAESPFKYSRAR